MIRHKGGENIRKQTIINKTLIPLLIFSLTLLFCIGISFGADTVYVNGTSGNDNNDGTSWATAKLSIKNATGTVNANGIINIADGTYSGENNTKITIDRNMTIIGESQTGTIISPISPGRIFFINSDLTVNLYNLTIQNCLVTEVGDNGGAIYNNGTNLNVNNCKFTNNNVVVGNGGAIYNNGGNLTITSTTFTSNTVLVVGNGGAIYNNGGNLTITSTTFTSNTIGVNGDGGSIYNNGGNLTITSSTFTNNDLLMGNGGAIYNNGGNLTITSSTFTSNDIIMNMNGCGGAIYNTGGNLTINSSTFTSNTALMGGGAIYNDGGVLEVTSCTFTSNTFNPVPGFGMIIGMGGAIYSVNGNCNIIGNIFTGNSANMGGAICSSGTLKVIGSIFSGNSANTGGAICSFGNCNVTGSTFTGNSANAGGAIGGLSGSSNLEVTNCTFTSNTATDLPGMPGSGGAIGNSGGTLKVTYSTFTGNTAGINEGKGMGSAIFNGYGDATINFNRIVGNSPSNGEIAGERIDATLNWWGSNISPVGKINEIVGGVILFDPWITLNITADPTSILNGGSSTVTASLLSDNQGTYHDPVLGHVPDIPLTLTVPWGNFITGKIITLNTVDGNITATFFANDGPVNLYNPVRVDASADGYTTNNLEAAYINIIQTANLTITKTGPNTIIAGNQITYTITATNTGPDPAANVVISDTFPPGISNISWNAVYSGGASGPTSGTGNININLVTLPVGGSCIITVTGTIPPSTLTGTILTNTVTITSSTHITDPTSATDTLTTTVNRESNIELEKTVDNARPDVGETVTFTVNAHNNGPSDATNIQIEDIMPAGFENVIVTPSKGDYDPISGIWTLDLDAGETATLTLTGEVTTLLAGKNTTNTATLLGTTNRTNATIYVPQADLYIQITSNKKNPTAGEKFTLTYKLGNNGPDDAENVTITIPIPEGFHISKITGDGTWNIVGNNIIWTFNNVTVGDPYLHITGWTTGPGNYLFTASIASETYNTNSMGVRSLTINAQPQVNAATTNTIGMQKTGTPLAGIALAILMVLGGFIGTRKKQ